MQQFKYPKTIGILIYCAVFSFCDGNSKPPAEDTATPQRVSVQDYPDRLFVRVFPGLILRAAPRRDAQATYRVPFWTRLMVSKSEEQILNRDTVLGLTGHWIPVAVPIGNEYRGGWVFGPLVGSESEENCFESRGNQLIRRSCDTMLETEKLHCLRIEPKNFPADFNAGCMPFVPGSLETPAPNTVDCTADAWFLLTYENKIRQNFPPQSNPQLGSWTKETDHISLNVEYPPALCREVCHGHDPEECIAECQKNNKTKRQPPEVFRLEVNESGFTIIRNPEGETVPVCTLPLPLPL